jgi:hypothetical protein
MAEFSTSTGLQAGNQSATEGGDLVGAGSGGGVPAGDEPGGPPELQRVGERSGVYGNPDGGGDGDRQFGVAQGLPASS